MPIDNMVKKFYEAYPGVTTEELHQALNSFFTSLEKAMNSNVDLKHLKVTVTGPKKKVSELAIKLRELRELGGKKLTQEQVAAKLEWSTTKLTRIETGHVSISVSDLKQLLAVYRVSKNQMEPYLDLARKQRLKN